MAYSTNDNIRQEAGFTGNTNITDARITSFKGAATSHMDGIIGRVYSLPLASTPSIVELIERKLAAGHMLLEEYGEQAEGMGKDGQKKVDWAEEMLRMIEEGLLRLVDTSGVELSKASLITMRGLPNKNTGTDKTDDADKDDPPMTEIGMKF